MPDPVKIIHFVQHRMVACQKPGPRESWPPDDLWSSSWQDVTCPECLKGRAPIDTFFLTTDGGITCLRCKQTSYLPADVANHYCGKCHVFHDDTWPPARRWWIDHPDQIPQ